MLLIIGFVLIKETCKQTLVVALSNIAELAKILSIGTIILEPSSEV
jgi:hypothetical protein